MAARFLIIDGYNVLHVCGFLAPRVGPGALQRARNLFLGMLARQLTPVERPRTTVVFDSRETDLPPADQIHDIHVEFAIEYNSADERIAVLIRQHSAPRQLTVVSSDHGVQKTARARGASFVDSDVWLEQILDRADSSRRDEQEEIAAVDPRTARGPVDLEYWLQELGLNESGTSQWPDAADDQAAASADETTTDSSESGSIHPFPPGYADDLFDDEDV